MTLEKQVHDLELKLRNAQERIKYLEAWQKAVDKLIKAINDSR